MIDKNDVKMPQQRDDNAVSRTKEQEMERIQKVEDLLDDVNDVANKQELRLDMNYYNKFHWFGVGNTGREGKSYFSYQEEAVYDFIFNLNRSGILSDQVGMGKTIEAGMIISELASRNELRSLLIVVPNEMMAAKWEYELSNKFGIKRHPYNGKYFPSAKVLLSYGDFCRCVFDCIANETFGDLYGYEFKHTYTAGNKQDTLADVMKSFVMADIKLAVKMINMGFINSEMNTRVEFTGDSFRIAGTKYEQKYVYDAKGEIKKFVGEQSMQRIDTVINNAFFQRNRYNPIITNELNSLYTLIGEYFTTIPEQVANVAASMTQSYPILIVPNTYTDRSGEKPVQCDFLNRVLSPEIKNYKHKYITKKEDGGTKDVYDSYRIIDFLIDVEYQTLIVDEVHDYIDVYAKVNRDTFHRNPEQFEADYPSKDFNRFELFDDYYFIEKKSLYKKLKMLADKAMRKIFLTATPIKSDMVDFYLLTLIASNKDASSYSKIRDYIDNGLGINDGKKGQGIDEDDAGFSKEKIEAAVENLFRTFSTCLTTFSAHNFCSSPDRYLRLETESDRDAKIPERDKRYKYPYFKNAFLRDNINNEELIKEYLVSQLNYMTVEEVVLELVLAYFAESKDEKRKAEIGSDLFKNIEDLLISEEQSFLQTRVVFRTILNNVVKLRFEKDFTEVKYRVGGKVVSESELTPEGKEAVDGVEREEPLKQIRQLLELKDGPRRWHKTYRTYGIRHTRHQTFNLKNCEGLQKLNPKKIERYNNLPFWPRRNGKVIFLLRDDNFFDCFLDVRRKVQQTKEDDIEATDLPNYEKMLGTPQEKQKRFEDAKNIFDYIDNAMSGGTADTHEPQSSRYDSVDLDDDKMLDYKLALVNKLMLGSDEKLGSIKDKVLLFAENGRDKILEWFRYQKCIPLFKRGEVLDDKLTKEYEGKWKSYGVEPVGATWKVSDSTDDMDRYTGNLLVVIDPSRYEKGVDLQKAETIINFDINYDPLKMEQRIGRIDRIRPGESREINIISFVPFNDMSGYVINFFANEMKMFTQWMGETTGIVSVLDDNDNGRSDDVSFGGKVDSLEKFYKDIYTLCFSTVSPKELSEMAADFHTYFDPIIGKLSREPSSDPETAAANRRLIENFGVNKTKTEVDFKFLQSVNKSFDQAFRNSVSSLRAGYKTNRKTGDKTVIRFNSLLGTFHGGCATESTCEKCPDRDICKPKQGDKVRNSYADFVAGVREFFEKGKQYYEKTRKALMNNSTKGEVLISGSDEEWIIKYLRNRKEAFEKTSEAVLKLLPPVTNDPMIISIELFGKIFDPMKKLFWDDVVDTYIQLILYVFHQQCDNVLQGAKMFERFIKVFSIAEFMNNMEGDNDV